MRYLCVSEDVTLGENVKLSKFINLYGCSIGDNTKIGAFVEIQKNSKIMKNCKISSHTFICEGVTIEDNVFIGHNVTFINDKYPRATNGEEELQAEEDWAVHPTLVKKGASIGSGSVILCNVTIGENAIVGAGSVVTRDVPPNTTVCGNPARPPRQMRSLAEPTETAEGAGFNLVAEDAARLKRRLIEISVPGIIPIKSSEPLHLCGLERSPAPHGVQGDAGERKTMKVPGLDLVTPHKGLEEELVAVFRDCLRNAAFVGGAQVSEFEKEFAQFCQTKHCVAVNSGTDALRFSLIAAGIGPGDGVITVPNTFIATTEAISQSGATPVFVDIDERTYNMDPNKLEDYLRRRSKEQGARSKECGTRNSQLATSGKKLHLAPRTSHLTTRPKAVLPVHLYGQPAEMDSIVEIAERYGLIVIEDACQAHGALYYSGKDEKWKRAGSMGLSAAFSFYPGKNLGACGEGGAVTTNDEGIAQKVRMLRDHGQAKKYYHDFEGYNGRLDAIQAGILRVKLSHLADWNESRRQNAQRYNELLANLDGVIVPYEPEWAKTVYHLYVIRTKKRDEIQRYLAEKGINTGLHYPIPLHLQKAYKMLGMEEGAFPISEKVAKEILSLPMYPTLEAKELEHVVSAIQEFVHNQKHTKARQKG
jgi:dTDP-4-amino-4,6-dideoxygalactose transaminase/acetyltransferase-like isoleucine patch superfamily enzyme